MIKKKPKPISSPPQPAIEGSGQGNDPGNDPGSDLASLIFIGTKYIEVHKFFDLSTAVAAAQKVSPPYWLVFSPQEDLEGRYWICCAADALELRKAGYIIL